MSLNEFRDLLARWAHWRFKASRATNGLAQSSYSEYVGHGAFGRDPIDDFDPDIHHWDQCYREVIPEEFRGAIEEHYLAPRNPQAKPRDRRYYERRKMVEQACIPLFRVFKERRETLASS